MIHYDGENMITVTFRECFHDGMTWNVKMRRGTLIRLVEKKIYPSPIGTPDENRYLAQAAIERAIAKIFGASALIHPEIGLTENQYYYDYGCVYGPNGALTSRVRIDVEGLSDKDRPNLQVRPSCSNMG